MRNERIAEELRILAAVRDGRLGVNEHGRYVIAGAAERPDRKARAYLFEKLQIRCARGGGFELGLDGRRRLADAEKGSAR